MPIGNAPVYEVKLLGPLGRPVGKLTARRFEVPEAATTRGVGSGTYAVVLPNPVSLLAR